MVVRRTVIGMMCLLGPATLAAQRDFAAIDSAVREQLTLARIPGAALVIVRGDRIIHARGFGIAGPGSVPVTPETPFYLGSTTKSITALAVLQLVQDGRVDLDAPVQRYLPWFTLADSAVSRTITVRHLLLHQGRIPGRAGEYFLADRDTSPAAAERHVRWLAGTQPGRPGFDYSNLGFTTLGLIVEVASGEPYAAYLRQHVFEPLGMRHAYTERSAARGAGLASGYAMRLGFPVVTEQPADRGDLAAGYLMASAADVGRYVVAHVNRGQVPGSAGVPAAAIEAMHRSRGTIVPDRDIAFGFSITRLEGVRILDISGSVPTYLSRFVIAPDSGWGVALLGNGNGALAEARFMDAALNAARMTMGKGPAPVIVPAWLRAIFFALLLLPLIQIVLALRAYRRLRRGERRHVRRELWPVVAGVLWGLFVLGFLPVLFQSYWPTMLAYQPDITIALLSSAVVALVWAGARGILVLTTAVSR